MFYRFYLVLIHFLYSEALFIRDVDSELVGLLFTVGDEFKAGLQRAIDHINNILNGEFKTTESQREAFKYLSLHYSWYCRDAENVSDTIAPAIVLPDITHIVCFRVKPRPRMFILTKSARQMLNASILLNVFLTCQKRFWTSLASTLSLQMPCLIFSKSCEYR